MGGRRIAQVGNSKFREHPGEHGPSGNEGEFFVATAYCLVSGPLVSPQKRCGQRGKIHMCKLVLTYGLASEGRKQWDVTTGCPEFSDLWLNAGA